MSVDAAERRQPTELELSLPWKRMEDEDEMPIVSPSFLPSMDFRLIDHRSLPTAAAAAAAAGVEFQLSSPDSDQAGGVRGITNPGFVDREDDGDRLGAASPLPSSSSSSAATSDVGNNNSRRGRQEETGFGRDAAAAAGKDETGKDDGKATGQHSPVTGKDQKEDDAVVSIEMHELGSKD